MAASVRTPAMEIVLREMSQSAPEMPDGPGAPPIYGSAEEKKKFEAARKKFAAAQKAHSRKVKTWVRVRVSVACALAHAVKDSVHMHRWGINPQGALTHAKMPQCELTLADGEQAAEFVRKNMDDRRAQGWRAQMSIKKHTYTSNPLGVQQSCCLCFVCGEYKIMGEAQGTPGGCLVAGSIRDHVEGEAHRRNVQVQQALQLREGAGGRKQARRAGGRYKKQIRRAESGPPPSGQQRKKLKTVDEMCAVMSTTTADSSDYEATPSGEKGGGEGGDSNLGMLTRAEKRQQEVKAIVLDALNLCEFPPFFFNISVSWCGAV